MPSVTGPSREVPVSPHVCPVLLSYDYHPSRLVIPVYHVCVLSASRLGLSAATDPGTPRPDARTAADGGHRMFWPGPGSRYIA